MRRFDDVLRIFCSVVLTAIIRDFRIIAKTIEGAIFGASSVPHAGGLGKLCALAYMVLIIRSLHGSAAFDSLLANEDGGRVEGSTAKGFINFMLATGAMLFYPAWVEYKLTDPSGIHVGVGGLGIFMFGWFIVYALWNIVLWLLDDKEHGEGALAAWVRLDGYVVAAILVAYGIYVYQWHIGGNTSLVLRVEAYVCIGMTVSHTALDYWFNRKFYWGGRQRRPRRWLWE